MVIALEDVGAGEWGGGNGAWINVKSTLSKSSNLECLWLDIQIDQCELWYCYRLSNHTWSLNNRLIKCLCNMCWRIKSCHLGYVKWEKGDRILMCWNYGILAIHAMDCLKCRKNDIYASSLKRTDNYEFILSVHRIPKPAVPMSYSAYIHITEGYTTIIFSER